MPINLISQAARLDNSQLAPLVLILFVVFALCGFHSPLANGQVLDLASAPRAPELGESTHASSLIVTLRSEVRDLVDSQRSAGGAARPVVEAMVGYRSIAIDLLVAGEDAGEAGSVVCLAGVCLFEGLADLDASLERLIAMIDEANSLAPGGRSPDEDRVLRAWQAVGRFDRKAAEMAGDLRTADAHSLDANLARVFAPLAEAVSLIEETDIVSHWPPHSAARYPDAAGYLASGPISRTRQSPGQLANRLSMSRLDDETRAAFDKNITMLKRAEAYADLRPQVEMLCSLLAVGLDLAEVVAEAEWLTEPERNLYSRMLGEAVADLGDNDTRARGRRLIERLDLSRLVIERISALDDNSDVQSAIGAALLAADAELDQENPDAAADTADRRLSRLRRALDLMIAYREAAQAELPRELRVLHRDLEDAYKRAEKALLADLTAIATDARAGSDPAFVTLLADQEDYLQALLLVRRMPTWIEKTGLIDPASAEPFAAAMRKTARQVLDPSRRPQAVRTLKSFERQISLVYPLPFEEELVAASPEAVAATGGLNGRLLDELQKQRTAWVRTWATADPDADVLDRMVLLHRLMSTMADTVEASRLGTEGGAVFNRWSAWELAQATLARTMNDVPTRLKLATGAVLQSDDVGLVRQLDRLDVDAPLARLIGRLNLVIGPAMVELPAGAVGVMGQLTRPPTIDAWLIHRRNEVASMCRYALEMDHARQQDDSQLAAEIGHYVNYRANRLLTELDAP